MSSTIESQATPDHIDALVDQLMPRPGPAWRRFAVGLALTVLVIVAGWSWMFGYLVPRPTANGSYSGGGQLVHDPERDAIAVSLHIPNFSRRDVRLTAASLDAPGVRLVDVGARPELVPFDGGGGSVEECEIEVDGAEVCTSAAIALPAGYLDPWPDTVRSLPVTIPAGGSADLFLALEPTACADPITLPWGNIDLTVDFGAGAMPPWSNTIGAQNPIIAEPHQAQLLAADRTVVHPPPLDEDAGLGGDEATVDGLLAAMCELTGGS